MMNYWRYNESWDWNTFGFLIPFTILDLVLKGFALYKSARKVNSVGILPLIYLLLNRDQTKTAKRK